jgi:hypothetical protein
MTQDKALAHESIAWGETRQRLQARWPGLTASELDATHGDRGELTALLEGHLGYARARAESDVDQFLVGDVLVLRDVADEDTHTGTPGAATEASGQTSEMAGKGSAYPWRAAAGIVAAVAGFTIALVLVANRTTQRKHLVIPLPTQAESVEAVEAAARAAGATWGILRSLAVLLVGGIAGWGARRYQTM